MADFEHCSLGDLRAVDVDSLNFGVIGLDGEHRVVVYNRWESERAGLSPERVLGLHFFTEVAPCMNNYLVAHRFETEEELDAALDYVFTLRLRPTPVKLRLLQAATSERSFLLVRWP